MAMALYDLCHSILLVLLEEDCVHVTDSDIVVLGYAWRTLPEDENCLEGSTLDHLLLVAVKMSSGQVRISCYIMPGELQRVSRHQLSC